MISKNNLSAGSKKPSDKNPDDKPSDVKSGDEAKPEDKKADADPEAQKREEEALENQRKQVQADNERKQKTYDDKVKAGKARAKELDARFANWYYVVSEDVFKKIHLGRADIVKKKAAAPAGDSTDKSNNLDPAAPVNPFRQLKNQP